MNRQSNRQQNRLQNRQPNRQSVEKSIEKSLHSYRGMIDSVGGAAAFPQGVSMQPLIRQGKGYVTIVKVDEPKPGDLLLFEHQRGDKKVNLLHRLIEIRADGTYVCRGDNCLNSEYIRKEDIIGCADRVFWTKDAGRLMPWLLRAERDAQNGGYRLSVTASGYRRYVKLWSAIWPLRRVYYRWRALNLLSRLKWHLKRIFKHHV